MRKLFTVAALISVVFLAGCNQQKAQITTYLQELEASTQKMKSIGEEMKESMAGLQQEISGGDFNPEEVKGRIQVYIDQMAAEKAKIEALKVPAEAQALHEATLKHYQTALDVLNETGPMLDIAAKLSEGAKKIQADPKKADEIMAEMKPVQSEMMELQQKVGQMAQEGQKFEQQASDEQKKLQDEFGIKPATESAVAETPSEVEVDATPEPDTSSQ